MSKMSDSLNEIFMYFSFPPVSFVLFIFPERKMSLYSSSSDVLLERYPAKRGEIAGLSLYTNRMK